MTCFSVPTPTKTGWPGQAGTSYLPMLWGGPSAFGFAFCMARACMGAGWCDSGMCIFPVCCPQPCLLVVSSVSSFPCLRVCSCFPTLSSFSLHAQSVRQAEKGTPFPQLTHRHRSRQEFLFATPFSSLSLGSNRQGEGGTDISSLPAFSLPTTTTLPTYLPTYFSLPPIPNSIKPQHGT